MWDQFPTFWGEVPNEKKYRKPVPPCFWHVAKIFFLMGKIFGDFTCDRKIFCQKYFSPPKKKSRKNFTCDRHLSPFFQSFGSKTAAQNAGKSLRWPSNVLIYLCTEYIIYYIY